MIGHRWGGHFEVLRALGEGREGTVFAARDLRDDSQVALKILRHRPDRPDRFEGMALRETRHPNLVRVLDVGLQENTAYLIQELLAAGTLRECDLPLDQEALLPLAEQMLSALGFLHGQGMLHGDVKPENIFVLSRDPWSFKLGDFGLARRSVDVGSGVTRGTPAFMPPEIIRGEPDDERSDFYSLGITLYECAFGELPFRSTSVRDLFAQHLKEEPERLSRPGNIPGGFLRLLRGLLQKDPALRPRTAVAAQSLFSGEPTTSLTSVPPRLGVLVGREQERRILVDALHAATACISIEGPEGIGKTRLLEEFGLESQLDDVPFWTWDVEGLQEATGEFRLPRESTDSNPTMVAAAWAAHVESSLGDGAWLLFVDQLDQRPAWFRESVAMFVRGAAQNPRPRSLVCVSGRESVHEFVGDALRQSGLPEPLSLSLQPWSRKSVRLAVAALLGVSDVGDSLVDLILEATGGVPAGVESAVRQLVEAKALRADTSGAVSLGLDVQPEVLHGDWLGPAVANLEPKAKRLLQLLSLLRGPAPEVALDGMMSLSVENLLASLHRKGLIASTTREDQIYYRPSHDGVRRAVFGGMPPADRAAIHDTIASYLEHAQESLPLEDIDWHRCLGWNREASFRSFMQLREKLAGERPEALLRLCQAMLDMWLSSELPRQRIQVETEMLRARVRLGEFESVRRLAPEAIKRADDPESEQIIRNCWCDALRAQSRYQEALNVLGNSNQGRPGAEGRHRKALMLSHLGRLNEALQICEQLEGELGKEDPLLVEVMDAKVAVLWEREDLDHARRVLTQALDSESTNIKSAWVLWTRLGQLEVGRGRMIEARRCFERSRVEAERTGDRYGLSRALSGIAVTQAETGDFDAAHETFLQVLELSQRLGESVNGTNILGNLGQMLAVQGLYGKALEYAGRGIDWASATAMLGLMLRIRIIRAGVLSKLGSGDDVLAELQQVLAASESDRYRGQALTVQAELALHTQDADSALLSLNEALELFSKNRIEDEEHRTRLLVARTHQLQGRLQESLVLVEGVARGAADLKLPDLIVEAEVLRAELLSESEPQLARERVGRALELARHFGFRESMWRAEALLAKLDSGADRAGALSHYRACLDLFREMTEGLPEHLTRSFLRLPRQRQILEGLESM